MIRAREHQKAIAKMNTTIDRQAETIQKLNAQNRILLDEVNLLMGTVGTRDEEIARLRKHLNAISVAMQYPDSVIVRSLDIEAASVFDIEDEQSDTASDNGMLP